jgi:DNA polymerase-4
MADGVARKLQDKSLVAGTVQVKIRTQDFATCTRQKALRPPANGSDAICTHARELLHEWLQQNAGARVRLLGAGTSALGPAVQADLFDDGGRHGRAPLDGTVKDIRDRFGEGAVSRARALPPADARRR